MDTIAELGEMLTTGEVARRLGVSQVAVRNWVSKGRLSYFNTRLGRLFDPAEVERLGRNRQPRAGTAEQPVPQELNTSAAVPEAGHRARVRTGP